MPVKVAHRDGTVVLATPELDCVAETARAAGTSERDLLSRTTAAAVAAGLRPGARLDGIGLRRLDAGPGSGPTGDPTPAGA